MKNTTRDSKIEADRLPDYSEYRDEGCDLSPSCLRCTLTRCRHDIQAEGKRGARALRNREIMKQCILEGKSAARLAQNFGVSRRTIQRIIRRSYDEQRSRHKTQLRPRGGSR